MITEFRELNIKDSTKQALESIGIESPTDVQALAIPYMLDGHDIIAQAQTGTGKTFAFAIPILEKIDKSNRAVQALVVCPTRELANQVYNEFKKIIVNNEYQIMAIYGGESYNKQFDGLRRNPDIIIATPGRVIDHLKRGTVNFEHLKVVVLDEADEMLKMGFQEDLESILENTPKERQTALFSATMPRAITNIAKKYQKDAKILKVETKSLTVDKIEQEYYVVRKKDRNNLLIRVIDYYTPEAAIIFCNTKNDVDNLVEFLQKNNYQADSIHGDLNQNQRDTVMKKFRENRLNYLVATDVAARGIDVKHVDFVINYEIPFENELYVHRIGRTGRAGKKGRSVSFVYPSTIGKMRQIESYIKSKIEEKQIPSVKDIEQRQKTITFDKIVDTITTNDKRYDEFLKYAEDKGLDADQVLHGLIAGYMVKENRYQDIQSYEAPQRGNRDYNSRGGNRQDSRGRQGGRQGGRNDRQASRQGSNEGKRQGGNKGNFALFHLNIGKNDGVKPAMFVEFMEKTADIFPRNIGDIKISNNEITFEVNKNSTRRADSVGGKFFNGKKLNITKL